MIQPTESGSEFHPKSIDTAPSNHIWHLDQAASIFYTYRVGVQVWPNRSASNGDRSNGGEAQIYYPETSRSAVESLSIYI